MELESPSPLPLLQIARKIKMHTNYHIVCIKIKTASLQMKNSPLE
jgi:hypothetical protein